MVSLVSRSVPAHGLLLLLLPEGRCCQLCAHSEQNSRLSCPGMEVYSRGQMVLGDYSLAGDSEQKRGESQAAGGEKWAVFED